jgi:hypothetical protein
MNCLYIEQTFPPFITPRSLRYFNPALLLPNISTIKSHLKFSSTNTTNSRSFNTSHILFLLRQSRRKHGGVCLKTRSEVLMYHTVNIRSTHLVHVAIVHEARIRKRPRTKSYRHTHFETNSSTEKSFSTPSIRGRRELRPSRVMSVVKQQTTNASCP